MRSGRRVTVVTPVYNERDNVIALVDELQALFSERPYELDIILVAERRGNCLHFLSG